MVGIKVEEGRRNTATLNDFLRGKGLNKMPSISVMTEQYGESLVDIVVIEDRSFKPFFPTRRLEEKGVTEIDGKKEFDHVIMNPGAIFERDGDSNTPVDSSAPDHSLEIMFKERLGFNLSPMDKVMKYLADFENWEKRYDRDNNDYYFHRDHPEVKFIERERQDERIVFAWALEFPNPTLAKIHYSIEFSGTEIASLWIVACDEYRYYTVLPPKWSKFDDVADRSHTESLYLIEGTLPHLFQQVLDTVHDQSSAFYIAHVIQVFASKEEAERLISEDYQNGCKKFIYFKTSFGRYARIDKNGEREPHEGGLMGKKKK
ncbi:MAG: hypothetical protein EOP04_05900 [Proteobacteria bacterium]|nr:MAG: hypothetical protein EOP04_05900 [Pseudomonadota bacterium]